MICIQLYGFKYYYLKIIILKIDGTPTGTTTLIKSELDNKGVT